jgi:kynurenine formamidase
MRRGGDVFHVETAIAQEPAVEGQMLKKSILFAAVAGVFVWTGAAHTHEFAIDLTHPIPTYHPMEGDPIKADLAKPWLNSTPHMTFERQAILTISEWPTNTGYFDSGKLIVDEHHGTHLDSLAHFLNNDETMEPGGIAPADRPTMESIPVGSLVGPVVLIDISGRVQAELDKNGGQPSPDISVTDFSEASANVVTPDDIEAVADQLAEGTWLVLNLGWSRFYFDGGADWEQSVYLNGFNHPGMNRAAVDKLVEVMERKGIVLAGIAADNLAIELGEGSVGEGDNHDTDVWYSHTRLFQKGVLLLENVANIGELATAIRRGSDCTLVVGAPKHTRGVGGPSRVIALCK